MSKVMRWRLCAVAGLLAGISHADLLMGPGDTYTQNFDSLGVSAAAALPADWKVSKNNATARQVDTWAAALSATEFSGGNSMSSTANNGMYNYGAGVAASATDRAVGFISAGSGTKSGNVYTAIQNTGSVSIASFTLAYDVEKYREGANAAGYSIQVYYSSNGSTWTNAGTSFLTSFAADAATQGYASAPGVTVPVSNTLTYELAPGSTLYLAWNYSVSSGTTTTYSQGLGVDNVVLTAIPEPGALGLAGAGVGLAALLRRWRALKA